MDYRTVFYVDPPQSYDSTPAPVKTEYDPGLSEFEPMTTDYAAHEPLESYAGVIKKLTLINFMNISNLSLTLSQELNFIFGQEGNISSIIQTAIGAVFSKDTTGSSKQLIKTGTQSCCIEVVLSNVGPRAYEPSLFGEEITICRTISYNSNSVHVKNQNGAIILSGDKDLMNIRSFFHIETWNPVSVMKKDTVAVFFSLNARKKYELFTQATMIDEIQELAKFQRITHKQLTDELMRNQQERRNIVLDIECLKEKRTSLDRTHNFLTKREAHEADYLTWAKKVGNGVAAAEHELRLRDLNARAEHTEKAILQNSKVEFDLKKRLSQVEDACVKNEARLLNINDLSSKTGSDEQSLNNSNSNTTQRNDTDANYLVEMKSEQVHHEFQSILRIRNVRARLVIDHGRQQIRIMVRPINSNIPPNGVDGTLPGETDISSVSPEGRAYFYIAFILALWKNSESPFFSIDGFDQLLSPVNKKYIFELFLSIAQAKAGCQFIIFTLEPPLLPPQMESSKSLKLIDLKLLSQKKKSGNTQGNANCFPKMEIPPVGVTADAVPASTPPRYPTPPPSSGPYMTAPYGEPTYLSDDEGMQFQSAIHPTMTVVRNVVPVQQHPVPLLGNRPSRAEVQRLRAQWFKQEAARKGGNKTNTVRAARNRQRASLYQKRRRAQQQV